MIAKLIAEYALREGEVPVALERPAMTTSTYHIARDAFLLMLPSGLRFHYRRGAGTVYARPDTVSDAEVALFFEGSVHGAIGWINGLVPLHASAVVHAGQIHAFTGQSGEGKSTLAAALIDRGFAGFCDDVLMLDLSDAAQIIAVPGHRRLKLWDDALRLTGQRASHAVRPGLDKFYAGEEGFADSTALPIARLYCLESAGNHALELTPIVGARRFTQVQSAFYRPHFHTAIAEQADYFGTVARLAGDIPMTRLHRPRDRARFAADVDLIADAIRIDCG